MWKLILLFTVLPALELFLLLQIGSALGAVPTVLLILVTGIVGGWLAKREGLAVLQELLDSLRDGLPPATQLVEGGLVVAGGLLLVTPGVLTDLVGFAFVLGPTRRWLAPVVLSAIARRFDVRITAVGMGAPSSDPRRPRASGAAPPDLDRHFDHPVS